MDTTYTYIKLNQGQYLSDVEPFKSTGIPTNHIIHKTVTGCGITTLEITAKRHSIIILPNVPVIRGKVSKYNSEANKKHHILGVYKGIEINQIENYIESDNVYKKILTTPEGFVTKVLAAFEGDLNALYKDYFMLFDECERIITDVDYRGKIAVPIKYLIKFEKKAMVSATILPFSDERFNSFKHIVITPTYDFSKHIKLIETNNVLKSFKQYVNSLASKRIAVFLNSTNAIFSLIQELEIQNESYVFCGEESAQKLKANGFRDTYHILDTDDMRKYTFFTSRFFSGVDIEVDYKPDVIFLTDVYFAEHSTLDPMTEIIQAAGRYRNGIKSLAHISNFNQDLISRTEQESRYYLNGCFDTYSDFVNSLNKTDHPGKVDTLKAAIESSPVHHFFDEDGVNTFMVDNYIMDQRVKRYYQNANYLKEAYEKLPLHFKVEIIKEQYTLGDNDRLKRSIGMSQKDHHREIAIQIDKLTAKPGEFFIEPEGTREYLSRTYPLIYKGYKVLGMEGLKETGYVHSAIKRAIVTAELNLKYKNCAAKVYAEFEENNCYTNSEIKDKLTPILEQSGIMKTTATDILRYFNGTKTTRNTVHVFCLTTKVL